MSRRVVLACGVLVVLFGVFLFVIRGSLFPHGASVANSATMQTTGQLDYAVRTVVRLGHDQGMVYDPGSQSALFRESIDLASRSAKTAIETDCFNLQHAVWLDQISGVNLVTVEFFSQQELVGLCALDSKTAAHFDWSRGWHDSWLDYPIAYLWPLLGLW